MIEDEIAREGLALLGTAATMLIEDAHFELAAPPQDIATAAALTARLAALGADLTALGGAALVLTRRAAGNRARQ